MQMGAQGRPTHIMIAHLQGSAHLTDVITPGRVDPAVFLTEIS
jgi:hypothetical protein